MRRTICLLCCLLCLSSALVFPARGADAYAYPEPEVLQIDLVMQPYRYLKMTHSAEKQKYDAVVCMNEGEPQPIGVQVCGDSSLLEGLEMASKRIPIELCFDYADPEGTFRGNPSLKLLNCKTPARFMTQLVAMQAFAFLDIPTPQITPAFLRINDTDFGLYLAVEDVNEAFMQSRFGGGSLYRSTKKNGDQDQLTSFGDIEIFVKVDQRGQALANYNAAQNAGDSAEAFLNADEILRFLACETFLNNEDGFLHAGRNFYLADDHGKLTLIPWDKDEVFLAFSKMNILHEFEKHAADFIASWMQNEAYYTKYLEYVKLLNDGFLNPDTFLPWLEEYIQFLAPCFQRDATISLQSDNVAADLTTGNELYNNTSGNLLLTFRTYHDQLNAQLCGESDSFSIPQGMTIWAHEIENDKDLLKNEGSDHSIIFRVCAGYWRLRRQALLQNDGKAMTVIFVVFAAVFVCVVFSVFRPVHVKHKRRRTKQT